MKTERWVTLIAALRSGRLSGSMKQASVTSGTSSCGSPVNSPSYRSAGSFSFTDSGTSGLDGEGERPPPELDFSLCYDRESERLGIVVLRGRHIPLLLHGGQPDVFLRLLLIRDARKGWGRRRSTLSIAELRSPSNGFDIAELRTPVARRTTTPIWEEFYQLELKVSALFPIAPLPSILLLVEVR